ncbi:Bacterial protein of uncharacterised function (DUF937) [Sphingobacterium spiritivorum]|uniref:DUF937 domain-containing protein n=2 Tax=Sphingobacterium spiritivorum TaxID=258 RepID=D7VQ71_SPHSI|nr:hypothetical protein HMPREF0766_13125 [Sphingobacterium spiritivorum ATCC 33861]QQT35941.1 DUF937 domain-containing protein [Sphingobacterium spiritivorum]SUJ13463.1 Bacterial protein of uncharacterised function (DUF937) [Sphingobacterium spiritivorum]
MGMIDLITGGIGTKVITALAGKLGISETKAKWMVAIAVPLMIAALKYNSSKKSEQAESLNNALDNKHTGDALDRVDQIVEDGPSEDDDKIINHMFGKNSDQVKNEIASKTGISSETVGTVLSTLAPIVMAYVGKEKAAQSNSGGIGDLLGGLLNGGGNDNASANGQQQQSSGGGIADLVSGFFDKNKDGNFLDDIAGMFTKK